MRMLLAGIVLPLFVAGCAGPEARLAQADCRIAPVTTAGVAGKPKQVDPLERRMAEMHLSSTDYRRRNLDRGPHDGLVEKAIRDCN